ncbi:MAG TPA: hypothetical protein VK850_11850 [Candidatus Binatia bacterium]|nr:hypothetical protein [Candidatus Binatia bacterium]
MIPARVKASLCLAGTLAFPFFANAQIQGSLTGRIVYMSAGHGWTFNSSGFWYTQRGVSFEMIEDYGNLDQMNFFAAYCLNAGATVVPFRPLGYQTNEVVLDNDSPGVTFVGPWSNSGATTGFYGTSGDVPYRFANLTAMENATAEYRPTLPVTGFYPVYTWAGSGANRGKQLYRIRHTGGESLVRVPHHMVGNGWVYLGNYYFDAGTNGAVIISNLRDPSDVTGTVVIADAIRFGNGIGRSGFAREEECSRYWVEAQIGVGAPTSIYDTTGTDDSDNVGTPPRMAAHMNREQSGSRYDRVFISFHSNAGGGRGTLGLHNTPYPGTYTSNQLDLARLVAQEINDDLYAQSVAWEHRWNDRGANVTYAQTFAFGEINNTAINDEFDATIIEVAFHDNQEDAELIRDPRVRQAIGRSACQGMIRYFNQFAGVPLIFLPEPPTNVRAIAQPGGVVRIQWGMPIALGGSAQGFVLHISTNGYGFAYAGGLPGGAATSLSISNLGPDVDWFFRVASTNSAGESLPSEVVGCRLANEASPFPVSRVLYVNGFDRFDRFLAPRQTAGSMTFDRCQPRRMNSFDYVVQHGIALGQNGVPYDSCQNEAILANLVRLTNYPAVIWGAGNESTADDTFSVTEQSRVMDYLDRSGRFFVSGAEIAYELNGTAFLTNYLHAALENDDARTNYFSPTPSSIFVGNPAARFDDGTFGTYNVGYPDRLTPLNGATTALVYGGSTTAAAIQSSNRLVYLGFPFETITTAAAREAYMLDVLKYFDVLPKPVILAFDPQSATVSWWAIPGKRYRLQYRTNLSAPTWTFVLGDATPADHMATRVDPAAIPGQRFYRVVMLEP